MVLDRHARGLQPLARTASLIGIVPGAPGGRAQPPWIIFALLGSVSPDPPISAGKSLSLGSPSSQVRRKN